MARNKNKTLPDIVYIPEGAVAVPLTQGFFTIIDKDDFEKVSQFNWQVGIRPNGRKYARKSPRTPGEEKLHRFIMNPPRNKEIDHINCDTLDNRKCNLRICDRAENRKNTVKQKGNFSSKYKGVHWIAKRNRWMSQIVVNKKKITIGDFSTDIEGAYAYDRAALKYHGEFARTNAMLGLLPQPPREPK